MFAKVILGTDRYLLLHGVNLKKYQRKDDIVLTCNQDLWPT